MKPWHWVLLVLCCVGAVCCGGGGLFLLRSAGQGVTASREAKEFAEPVLVEFGKTWDFSQVLAEHGTEEARKVVSKEEAARLQRLMKNRVGPLQSFGSWTRVFLGNDQGQSYMRLTGTGTAEKGPVTFEATLMKRDGAWKIQGLKVNSPRLIADP